MERKMLRIKIVEIKLRQRKERGRIWGRRDSWAERSRREEVEEVGR